MCPALNMVDDCALATRFGVRLDAEAKELCNRHQVCYACVSILTLYKYIQVDRVCSRSVSLTENDVLVS